MPVRGRKIQAGMLVLQPDNTFLHNVVDFKFLCAAPAGLQMIQKCVEFVIVQPVVNKGIYILIECHTVHASYFTLNADASQGFRESCGAAGDGPGPVYSKNGSFRPRARLPAASTAVHMPFYTVFP